VVAQLALSVVSLVSAGLFLRSLAAVGRTDLGFRAPEQVLVASTDLTLGGRSADSAGRRLVGRWVERVRALPGVETAAVSDYVPLGLGYSNRGTFVADGYAARPDENLSFLFNTVGEHYFRTLGIPLVRGRAFDARDGAAAPPVAIVNETYARRFLAGRDPVGATARYAADGPPVTIVGVAADGRYGMEDLAGAPVPFVYVPYAQRPSSTVFLQVRVRAGADPLALVPAVRRALAAEDPALPLVRPTTLALWSRTASFVQRIGATVLMVLGTVALLLAAVGLYGVTAYTVARRTREIGVRVALGATTRRVVAGVLRDGGRTAAAGLVLGTVAAFAAARLLAAQLQGVRADDPAVFGAAGLLLLAVALAASWLPARRAARVPPTEALRAD
jgi:predicted permease